MCIYQSRGYYDLQDLRYHRATGRTRIISNELKKQNCSLHIRQRGVSYGLYILMSWFLAQNLKQTNKGSLGMKYSKPVQIVLNRR